MIYYTVYELRGDKWCQIDSAHTKELAEEFMGENSKDKIRVIIPTITEDGVVYAVQSLDAAFSMATTQVGF